MKTANVRRRLVRAVESYKRSSEYRDNLRKSDQIEAGVEFDEKIKALNERNQSTPSLTTYPQELDNVYTRPNSLMVRNRRDYTEIVGHVNEKKGGQIGREINEDYIFYKELCNKDPEAAKFYLDFHVDSYSNTPLTEWGKARRNARQDKDIYHNAIKVNDTVIDDEGREVPLIDVHPANGDFEYNEERVYKSSYTENDWRGQGKCLQVNEDQIIDKIDAQRELDKYLGST